MARISAPTAHSFVTELERIADGVKSGLVKPDELAGMIATIAPTYDQSVELWQNEALQKRAASAFALISDVAGSKTVIDGKAQGLSSTAAYYAAFYAFNPTYEADVNLARSAAKALVRFEGTPGALAAADWLSRASRE